MSIGQLAPVRCRRVPHLGLAALIALASSCTQPDDPALRTVHRLAQEVVAPTEPGPIRACAVDDDIRPALGCPATTVVRRERPTPTSEGLLRLQFDLPPDLHPGPVILTAQVEENPRRGWLSLPPRLARGSSPHVEWTHQLDRLQPGRKPTVGIDALVVPPAVQGFRTRPVAVGNDAVLRLAVAILPVAAQLGASAAEFVVTARSPSGESELLRTIVDAKVGQGWLPHRVSLAHLAGQEVEFHFATRVRDEGRHEAGEEAFSIPLWGGPTILEPASGGARRNVIVVSLDTMRGDVVGAVRAGHAVTPQLDRLAAQGTRFTRAFTTYPSTTASHMSLLTGLYPIAHGVLHAKYTLGPAVQTLAQVLGAHGYLTAAVTEDAMLAAEAGFVRGFDDYRENRSVTIDKQASGDVERTVAEAIRWLERSGDTQFFLFLHTYQVHAPYAPPSSFDRFAELPLPGRFPQIDQSFRSYLGEASYTDDVLARLFEALQTLDLARRSIVVITADHGEEFGEHGALGHGTTLHDEVLHIPLIVWAPGLVPAGSTIDAQVSLVDAMPTILDLLQIAPPPGLHGESLAPLLRGHGDTSRSEVRFAEGPALRHPAGRQIGARTTRYKWIGREHLDDPELVYDLVADPGETTNVADAGVRAEGRRLLAAYRALSATVEDGQGERELDPSTASKLRALGYVE